MIYKKTFASLYKSTTFDYDYDWYFGNTVLNELGVLQFVLVTKDIIQFARIFHKQTNKGQR